MLAVMAASDLELGYAGAKVYSGFRSGARFEVLLFRTDAPFSVNDYPAAAFAYRTAGDPLGAMQPEVVVKAGETSYVSPGARTGSNRWGDYNGVAADPSNPRVIWFYSMYASAANTWGTWIGSAFF